MIVTIRGSDCIQAVEAKDAAEHPIKQKSPKQRLICSKVSRPKLRHPEIRGTSKVIVGAEKK